LIDFLRDAPVGAIILIVLGIVLIAVITPIRAHNDARIKQLKERGEQPTERDQAALQQQAYIRMVGYGCLLAGLAWNLISA
jgi:hypothetical protein